MSFDLCQDVVLTRDLPDESLCRGDVATIVDRIVPPGGESGYVLEVFNGVGETVKVIIVPASAIEPLSADEIWSVRRLVRQS